MTFENSSTVVFWNIWGHRHPNGLAEALKAAMPETDIFCLTEVTDIDAPDDLTPPMCYTGLSEEEPPSQLNGLSQLEQMIDESGGDYCTSFITPRRDTCTCVRTGKVFADVGFGSALIYRNDLLVVTQGSILVCAGYADVNARVLQWVVYRKDAAVYLVAHIHGVWLRENTKGDDPIRDQQSSEVLAAIYDISREWSYE